MLRKSSISQNERPYGQHRFEHWYRDNSIYFITARCRNRTPAFATEEAKSIFWTKFHQSSDQFAFKTIIVSLLDNHYHLLGYLKTGENLGPMMQRFHGSVSKLVNDTLSARLKPFWYDTGKQGYFDGCIRNELQLRRAYRYTLNQCVRHRVHNDPTTYPHTRVRVEVDAAVKRAHELRAFLSEVPYARYGKQRPK